MSLINDALRRAHEAQPRNSAPADGPSFRAVEGGRRSGTSNSLLLPAVSLGIILLAGALLWTWSRSGSEALKVRANTPATAVVPAVTTLPDPPSPKASNHPAPAAPSPLPTPSSNPGAATPADPATNGLVLLETPKFQADDYKLQGIFYRRTNPAAVINGHTVFLGDRVGNANVYAIAQDTVTIVTLAGQTNILDLPQ